MGRRPYGKSSFYKGKRGRGLILNRGVSRCYTWAIGGGKGGVGKSVMSAVLAMDLAGQGHRVVLIDADLAGANLHALFGIRYPQATVLDLVRKKVSGIRDILIPTSHDRLSLICSSPDLIDLPNPANAHKEMLLSAISELDADHLIIDIGAGVSVSNLDFFNAADSSMVVTSSLPTSVQNTYSFLKMALHRRVLSMVHGSPSIVNDVASALGDNSSIKNMVDLVAHVGKLDESVSWQMIKCLVDSRYRLVVNMASEMDSHRIANALAGLVYQFLRVKLPCFGTLGFSHDIEQSVHKIQPLELVERSIFSRDVRKITLRMLEESRAYPTVSRFDRTAGENASFASPAAAVDRMTSAPAPEGAVNGRPEGAAETYAASKTASDVQLCLNDEMLHEGITLHIQTEDLGIGKAKVLTLVFSGGHILFSKSADYAEFADQDHIERSVAERVRWQHKAIMAGIKAGKLNDRLNKEGGA